MYKALLGATFLICFNSSAAMALCSSYTTLSNGSIADANQVMLNFSCAALTDGPTINNPTFTGNVGIGTATPSYPLDMVESGTAANVRFKSTLSQASLNLDGATGQPSQMYNNINGSSIWASGITGGGPGNAYNWYSYIGGLNAFNIGTSGDVTAAGCVNYNGGSSGSCLSDAKLKKNVAPFTAGLDQIIGLEPVTYQYNGLANSPIDENIRTGLIAQQVQKVAPQFVETTQEKLRPADDKKTELLKVKYGDLTFALINAVKELKVANDNQAAQIRELHVQVGLLERRLNQQTAGK